MKVLDYYVLLMISVVIPTNNRKKDLERLLESLSGLDIKHEIIIVNDNKKELEISNLKNENVIIIQNPDNMGLAYSRNVGAKNSKYDYILFIDDDNVIYPESIKNLLESLQKFENLVAVGPLTYHYQDKNAIWFIGVEYNYTTSHVRFYKNIDDSKLIDEVLIPTSNLHNCFMVKRRFGEDIGWFDEKLFMSGTELDMFNKIKRKHKNTIIATHIKALCYHDVPILNVNNIRTLGFNTIKRVYYTQRNRAVIIRRYSKPLQKIIFCVLFYPAYFLAYTLIFLLNKKPEFIKTHLRGTFDGYYYLITGKFR